MAARSSRTGLTVLALSLAALSFQRDTLAQPDSGSTSSSVDATAALPLRPGDLVFQTSRSAQSRAIQLATHSRYSHVGIVDVRGGKTVVLEAVGPVKLTPLDEWIARGEGHHYTAMRLRDADARLTPEALAAMRAVAARFVGKEYDWSFAWSDERLYCSELVWKIYDRALGIDLGKLAKLRDFDLASPVVQAALRERYGAQVPLEEPVISPGAMAAAEQLVVVRQQ